jgi:ribonuclease Z
MSKDNYEQYGDFSVLAWSISGHESIVIVKSPFFNCLHGNRITFDMGIALNESLFCDHVLITHGHIDHVSAIVAHARKKQLSSQGIAKYYVPESIAEDVKQLFILMSRIHGEDLHIINCLNDNIIPVSAGTNIELHKNVVVKCFETHHRIQSFGFMVYVRNFQDDLVPQMAYLGDTKFSVFQQPERPEIQDLLTVQLLITEATYIDRPETRSIKAREYGHTHLQEFIDHFNLFKDVRFILLVHMSDRYGAQQIWQSKQRMPQDLFCKVFFSTLAKQCQ